MCQKRQIYEVQDEEQSVEKVGPAILHTNTVISAKSIKKWLCLKDRKIDLASYLKHVYDRKVKF